MMLQLLAQPQHGLCQYVSQHGVEIYPGTSCAGNLHSVCHRLACCTSYFAVLTPTTDRQDSVPACKFLIMCVRAVRIMTLHICMLANVMPVCRCVLLLMRRHESWLQVVASMCSPYVLLLKSHEGLLVGFGGDSSTNSIRTSYISLPWTLHLCQSA